MGLVFIDVEAWGGSPVTGLMTEFGVVTYPDKKIFHGKICPTSPDPSNPAIPLKPTIDHASYLIKEQEVFSHFELFLEQESSGRPIMVSDNPAYDFQWVNSGFWRALNRNPLGHSARRIGDFWAGVELDFYAPQKWKKFRRTPHDHNPVNDAMGNVEAFEEILRRVKLIRKDLRL
jgi:hypothetical protein